jgi:hypothetical protein
VYGLEISSLTMKVSALVLFTAALARPLQADYRYDLAQYEEEVPEYYDQDYAVDYDQEYDEDSSMYDDQDYDQYYEDTRIPSYGASRLDIGRVSPAAYESVHNADATGNGARMAGVPTPLLAAEGSMALNAASRSLGQAAELANRAALNNARGRADTIDRLSAAHLRMANTAIREATTGMAAAAGTPPPPFAAPVNPAAGLAIGRANHLAKVVGDAHMAARLRDAANRARAAAPAPGAGSPPATRPRSNEVVSRAPSRRR